MLLLLNNSLPTFEKMVGYICTHTDTHIYMGQVRGTQPLTQYLTRNPSHWNQWLRLESLLLYTLPLSISLSPDLSLSLPHDDNRASPPHSTPAPPSPLISLPGKPQLRWTSSSLSPDSPPRRQFIFLPKRCTEKRRRRDEGWRRQKPHRVNRRWNVARFSLRTMCEGNQGDCS